MAEFDVERARTIEVASGDITGAYVIGALRSACDEIEALRARLADADRKYQSQHEELERVIAKTYAAEDERETFRRRWDAAEARLAEVEKERDAFAQDQRLCHNAWREAEADKEAAEAKLAALQAKHDNLTVNHGAMYDEIARYREALDEVLNHCGEWGEDTALKRTLKAIRVVAREALAGGEGEANA